MKEIWKKCSTCKKEIAFEENYWACNVSTCNRHPNSFIFCGVACWDAHLPTMNHRESWAVEKKAPSKKEWTQIMDSQNITSETKEVSKDILIVASKLKTYIKVKSDFSTSADVMEILSDKVRRMTDEAIQKAKQSGRKTVMARDF